MTHTAAAENLKAKLLYVNGTAAYRTAEKGQVVGTIDFQLNGKSIEQRPLIVMENVEEGGFFGRMWIS